MDLNRVMDEHEKKQTEEDNELVSVLEITEKKTEITPQQKRKYNEVEDKEEETPNNEKRTQLYDGKTEAKENETTRKENWREKPKVTGTTESTEQSETTEIGNNDENQQQPRLKIKLKQPTLKEIYAKKTQKDPNEELKCTNNITETTAKQEHPKLESPHDSLGWRR